MLEETITDPRVESEPYTYKLVTCNSVQLRHQKACLTKAAAKQLSKLALIAENNTKGTDHYLTPLEKYE